MGTETENERPEPAEEVLEAIRTFLAKYDECEQYINGAFQFMAIHGAPYSGDPNYGEELNALRALAAQAALSRGEGK